MREVVGGYKADMNVVEIVKPLLCCCVVVPFDDGKQGRQVGAGGLSYIHVSSRFLIAAFLEASSMVFCCRRPDSHICGCLGVSGFRDWACGTPCVVVCLGWGCSLHHRRPLMFGDDQIDQYPWLVFRDMRRAGPR